MVVLTASCCLEQRAKRRRVDNEVIHQAARDPANHSIDVLRARSPTDADGSQTCSADDHPSDSTDFEHFDTDKHNSRTNRAVHRDSSHRQRRTRSQRSQGVIKTEGESDEGVVDPSLRHWPASEYYVARSVLNSILPSSKMNMTAKYPGGHSYETLRFC